MTSVAAPPAAVPTTTSADAADSVNTTECTSCNVSAPAPPVMVSAPEP